MTRLPDSTPRPEWLAPSIRLARWVTAANAAHPELRRDLRPLLRPARILRTLARPVRPRATVGQAPDDATTMEERAADAWERIREGGQRALDRAHTYAAELAQGARVLAERWHAARRAEAEVISELADGVAELARGAASIPRTLARSGRGLALAAAAVFFMWAMSRSRGG